MSAEPVISFLIPTYNADAYLEQCLKSIRRLDYPSKKIEIIVADGGSTDKTLRIAKKFKATIAKNKRRIAEYGKWVAFMKSKGEVVVFLDADNVLASRSWAKRMLPTMADDVVGAESNYLIAKDFSSLNKYANLLVIVDPLARMLASKPQRILQKGGYIVKGYKKRSVPVSGANGFMWKRSVLQEYADTRDELNEVGILNDLCSRSAVKIANVPKNGIYHYYCSGLKDYIKKRVKIATKHLNRSKQSETWVRQQGGSGFMWSVLYLGTIIGPLCEALYNTARTGRVSWLWHPLIGFITVATYTGVFIKTKLNDAKNKSAA